MSTTVVVKGHVAYTQNNLPRIVAGRLALDFLNTSDWTPDGKAIKDNLASLEDLDVWRKAVGLTEAVMPKDIQAIWGFRRSLRSVFVNGMSDPGDPLDLSRHVSGFWLRSNDVARSCRQNPLLSLVAHSAISIISDEREMRRIKLCPGENCGWLFLDETKNGRRKWCEMETCGNRAKVTRHYAKQRQSGMNQIG